MYYVIHNIFLFMFYSSSRRLFACCKFFILGSWQDKVQVNWFGHLHSDSALRGDVWKISGEQSMCERGFRWHDWECMWHQAISLCFSGGTRTGITSKDLCVPKRLGHLCPHPSYRPAQLLQNATLKGQTGNKQMGFFFTVIAVYKTVFHPVVCRKCVSC